MTQRKKTNNSFEIDLRVWIFYNNYFWKFYLKIETEINMYL